MIHIVWYYGLLQHGKYINSHKWGCATHGHLCKKSSKDTSHIVRCVVFLLPIEVLAILWNAE